MGTKTLLECGCCLNENEKRVPPIRNCFWHQETRTKGSVMSILCKIGIHIERFYDNDVAGGSSCPCGKKVSPPMSWPLPPEKRLTRKRIRRMRNKKYDLDDRLEYSEEFGFYYFKCASKTAESFRRIAEKNGETVPQQDKGEASV